MKLDNGRPRYDLIPIEALEGWATNLRIGATKYAERNWEKGIPYSQLYRALLSHLFRWWDGEEMDEDGFHHLDAVLFHTGALRTYVARYMGRFDDRLQSLKIAERYKEYVDAACGECGMHTVLALGNCRKCDTCGATEGCK